MVQATVSRHLFHPRSAWLDKVCGTFASRLGESSSELNTTRNYPSDTASTLGMHELRSWGATVMVGYGLLR